jgi:hypothetical protein
MDSRGHDGPCGHDGLCGHDGCGPIRQKSS